jgi:hypothetical protein
MNFMKHAAGNSTENTDTSFWKRAAACGAEIAMALVMSATAGAVFAITVVAHSEAESAKRKNEGQGPRNFGDNNVVDIRSAL